jgi:bifunctional non-homologous end joining protein LigD
MTSGEVTVAGRRLKLSNLDKVLYPAVGFTKAQALDYYARISPVLLPHLKGRPLTLKRYPEGVEGGHFYQKRCPAHRPSWVRTAPVWSARHRGTVDYCLIDDLATLIWAANLADLELHTSLSRVAAPERPTVMVFDLDPGAPAGLVECCELALVVRAVLRKNGLESFAKTSGAKGLQVYVPLSTQVGYDDTKSFARSLAEALERRQPDRVVSRMQKALRPGKVFVDWSQNDFHKTTVCVYSLRAGKRPTVSTPVTWGEVQKAVRRRDAKPLHFTADEVLVRVAKMGDLFAPVERLKQRLARDGLGGV